MRTIDTAALWSRQSWKARRNRRLLAFVCLPGLTAGTATLVGANAAGVFAPRVVRVCEVSAGIAPLASSFPVRVYNASGIDGQAGKTAQQLTKKGFHVIDVGNAPESRWFDGTAILVHGPAGALQADLVANTGIAGATQRTDGRDDVSVDIFLGAPTETRPAPSRPPAAVRGLDDCTDDGS